MKSGSPRNTGDVLHMFYDCAEKDDNLVTKTVLDFVNSSVERKLGQIDSEWLFEFKNNCVKCDATILTALVLIDKFRRLNPKPSIFHELTAIDLLVVTTLAAVKFIQDTDSMDAITNYQMADFLNVDLSDINKAELDFYNALNWNLFVSNSDFTNFLTEVIIQPVRSRIESAERHKSRVRRATRPVPNKRIECMNISKQSRRCVFAGFPSVRSVALAATALFTISCSASLFYHQPGSRVTPFPWTCNIPNVDRLSQNSTSPTTEDSVSFQPTVYISNETRPYPLVKYTPPTCGVQHSSYLVQNPSLNSSILVSGVG